MLVSADEGARPDDVARGFGGAGQIRVVGGVRIEEQNIERHDTGSGRGEFPNELRMSAAWPWPAVFDALEGLKINRDDDNGRKVELGQPVAAKPG